MDYFNFTQDNLVKDEICRITDGDVPCEGKFLEQFVSMYQANKQGIKESLVTL